MTRQIGNRICSAYILLSLNLNSACTSRHLPHLPRVEAKIQVDMLLPRLSVLWEKIQDVSAWIGLHQIPEGKRRRCLCYANSWIRSSQVKADRGSVSLQGKVNIEHLDDNAILQASKLNSETDLHIMQAQRIYLDLAGTLFVYTYYIHTLY